MTRSVLAIPAIALPRSTGSSRHSGHCHCPDWQVHSGTCPLTHTGSVTLQPDGKEASIALAAPRAAGAPEHEGAPASQDAAYVAVTGCPQSAASARQQEGPPFGHACGPGLAQGKMPKVQVPPAAAHSDASPLHEATWRQRCDAHHGACGSLRPFRSPGTCAISDPAARP